MTTATLTKKIECVHLVDDDPAVLKGVSRLLASHGLSVQSFNQPKSFLAHAENNAVSLVILDIWMEQMNGLEVQSRLRAISPSTRVIIVTGREDHAAKTTALECGAIAFFLKPFDDEKFLAAVDKGLRG